MGLSKKVGNVSDKKAESVLFVKALTRRNEVRDGGDCISKENCQERAMKLCQQSSEYVAPRFVFFQCVQISVVYTLTQIIWYIKAIFSST